MFHRASSVLEDNASQHPVQSPGVVDVSPVDLGVHKGQKILVSVNVVLVLNLYFNFIIMSIMLNQLLIHHVISKFLQ